MARHTGAGEALALAARAPDTRAAFLAWIPARRQPGDEAVVFPKFHAVGMTVARCELDRSVVVRPFDLRLGESLAIFVIKDDAVCRQLVPQSSSRHRPAKCSPRQA